MRIVRTRSIPTVDSERLRADLAELHRMIHADIIKFAGSRRDMINHGMKLRRIVAELLRRGDPPPACPHCRLTGNETYIDRSTS